MNGWAPGTPFNNLKEKGSFKSILHEGLLQKEVANQCAKKTLHVHAKNMK